MANSKQRRKERRLKDRLESSALTVAVNKTESVEKKEPVSMEMFATRQKSIDFVSALYASLANPDPVLEARGETIQVYNDLMYDSRVIACTDSRKSAVRGMEWDITSETNDQAAIDFHLDYFKNYDMERVVGEILDAPLYGYKPNEIMWLPDGGKIIPYDFVGKPPEWFTYDNDNKLRMLTESNMIDGEEVPDNKFIVATSKASYKNPYGVGILSSCFWPVLFRRNGFKFLAVFVEKYGMPFLVGKAPSGEKTERMEEILDILENIVQDGVTVVPEDYEITVVEGKEGKGKSDNVHKVFLDIMNNEIALAVLGTNLTTNVEGGSFAAAEVHMEVRRDIIESDRRIVERTLNSLIRLTHRINFGNPDDAPVISFYRQEEIDKTRAERDQIIVNSLGVKFTDKYIEEKYNLAPEDYERTEVTTDAPVAGAGGDDV